MNDFKRDDKWQREKRDSILVPEFYERYTTNGKYIFFDKGELSMRLQKEWSIDTLAVNLNGEAALIEEKIVRWPKYDRPHTAYCLETESCTKPGHESPGWMYYGKATHLLYCFEQKCGGLICHLIKFRELKKKFWDNHESFKTFGPLDTLNATFGRKVPIAWVEAEVGVKKYFCPKPSSDNLKH